MLVLLRVCVRPKGGGGEHRFVLIPPPSYFWRFGWEKDAEKHFSQFNSLIYGYLKQDGCFLTGPPHPFILRFSSDFTPPTMPSTPSPRSEVQHSTSPAPLLSPTLPWTSLSDARFSLPAALERSLPQLL